MKRTQRKEAVLREAVEHLTRIIYDLASFVRPPGCPDQGLMLVAWLLVLYFELAWTLSPKGFSDELLWHLPFGSEHGRS